MSLRLRFVFMRSMCCTFIMLVFHAESTVFINRVLNCSNKTIYLLAGCCKRATHKDAEGTPIYYTIPTQKAYSNTISIGTNTCGIPLFGSCFGTVFISVGPSKPSDTKKLPSLCCSFCEGEDVNELSDEIQERLDKDLYVDKGRLVTVPRKSTIIGLSEPLCHTKDYWFDLKVTPVGIEASLVKCQEHVTPKRDFPEPLSPSGSDE